MAKKVVATLKTTENAKNWAKVIRAVKSEKTGAYTFKEEMILLTKCRTTWLPATNKLSAFLVLKV